MRPPTPEPVVRTVRAADRVVVEITVHESSRPLLPNARVVSGKVQGKPTRVQAESAHQTSGSKTALVHDMHDADYAHSRVRVMHDAQRYGDENTSVLTVWTLISLDGTRALAAPLPTSLFASPIRTRASAGVHRHYSTLPRRTPKATIRAARVYDHVARAHEVVRGQACREHTLGQLRAHGFYHNMGNRSFELHAPHAHVTSAELKAFHRMDAQLVESLVSTLHAYRPVPGLAEACTFGPHPCTAMSTIDYTNPAHNDFKDYRQAALDDGVVAPSCAAMWTFTDGIDGVDAAGAGLAGGQWGGQFFLRPTFGVVERLRHGITIEWSGNPQNKADTDCLHCSSTIQLPEGVHVHSFFHAVPALLVSELRAWRAFARALHLQPRLGPSVGLEVGDRLLVKVPTVSGHGHANHSVGTVMDVNEKCVFVHCEHDPKTVLTTIDNQELHDHAVMLTPEVELRLAMDVKPRGELMFLPAGTRKLREHAGPYYEQRRDVEGAALWGDTLKRKAGAPAHGRRFSSDEDGDGPSGAVRKARPDHWGRADKASRERARRAERDKHRRKEKREEKEREEKREAFEREAFAQSHPQECPVCMTRLMTHLLFTCGMTVSPFHRHHGLCAECALDAVNAGSCPFCRQAVTDSLEVGLEIFA